MMSKTSLAVLFLGSLYLYSKGKNWILRAVIRYLHKFISKYISIKSYLTSTSTSQQLQLQTPQAQAFDNIFAAARDPKRPPTLKDFRAACDAKLWEPINDPPASHFQQLNILGINTLKISYSKQHSSYTNACILHFHGGGFIAGSAQAYSNFCIKLSQRCSNINIYSVNYSLCPENAVTKAVNECVTVYKELQRQFGYKYIILAGDSAGGGMVLAVLQKLQSIIASTSMEGYLVPPLAAVMICPYCDFSLSGESYKFNAETDYLLSPQSFELFRRCIPECKDSSFRGFLFEDCTFSALGNLAVYICVSKTELLFSDAERLVENIKRDNKSGSIEITYDVARFGPHIYPVFGDFAPEFEEGLSSIVKFINSSLASTMGKGMSKI